MARDDTRPIVIKRIKKHAAGHHGGAWKIAYADFVTAMMAFFLLMWLLGSTAKGDLNGIAEYFSTPLAVAMRGGSGAGDASSVIQGGGQDLTRSAGQVKRGENDAEKRTYNLAAMKAELARQERLKLEDIKSKVEAAIAANPGIAQFRSQILLDITREGLRIQIVDDQNRPMFDTGRAVLKPYAAEILREIGAVLNGVDHKISLAGHTDSAPYAGGEKGYSNWELSTARANASRRELLGAGLDEGKVIRVVGLAASVPFDVADPKAPANRRISIVVLNKQAEETLKSGAVTVEAADAADAQKALEETAAASAAAAAAAPPPPQPQPQSQPQR